MVNTCNSLAELKEKIIAANLDDKLVVIYFWCAEDWGINCGCSRDYEKDDEIEKLASEEKKDVVFLEVYGTHFEHMDCEEALCYLMQRFNIQKHQCPNNFILIKDGAIIDEVWDVKVSKL